MRKIISTTFWAALCLSFLPICLSANKYPPNVLKEQAKLENCEGMQRIKTLSHLIYIINPYDTSAAQKYFREGDSLLVSFTKEEQLEAKTRLLVSKSWAEFYNSNYLDAFKISLINDSLTQELSIQRDTLDDFMYTNFINGNSIRAAIYHSQEQFYKSQRELEKSVELCKKMKEQTKLGSSLNNLGIVLMYQEKYEAAETSMLTSDSIYTAQKSDWNLAYCKLLRIDLYRNSGEWEKGNELFESGGHLVRNQLPSRINNLNAYVAEIAYELGQKAKSDSLIAHCLATINDIKEPAAIAESKKVIAGIYKKQGRFEESINLHDESEEDLDAAHENLQSKQLFELQEKYEQSKFIQPAKNSNKALWLLLGLVPFGLVFFFLYRKSPPVEPTSHTLEIAWKDESLIEQKDPFLERFVELVQTQMEEGDVSVDGISEQMKISRVQLFKKIKAITGKSPSQVIRQIRLETAERLLVENNSTVSEIAYRVGFSSPNNFSRSFKDYFGETPKSYQAKKLG